MRQRPHQRSSGSELPVTIKDVPKAHAPIPTVAESCANRVAETPNAVDHVPHALLTQHIELILGDRPQPGSKTPREDRDWKRHARSTLVPSKSNRNRTSSRPAFAIAPRSLR